MTYPAGSSDDPRGRMLPDCVRSYPDDFVDDRGAWLALRTSQSSCFGAAQRRILERLPRQETLHVQTFIDEHTETYDQKHSSCRLSLWYCRVMPGACRGPGGTRRNRAKLRPEQRHSLDTGPSRRR